MTFCHSRSRDSSLLDSLCKTAFRVAGRAIVIEVVEHFVLGKGGRYSPEQNCEDGIVVTDSHVAVIDGSTDPFGQGHGTTTPGRQAMIAIRRAVSRLPAQATAREMVDLATAHVRESSDGLRGAAAVIGVYSAARRELWQVGDVCYWWRGLSQTPVAKPVDVAAARFRAAILATRLADGETVNALRTDDVGRSAILPLLHRQKRLRNSEPGRVSLIDEWRYGAVDGEWIPDSYVRVVAVPATVDEIVLHTDGYPRSWPALHDAERDLRERLDEDPLCIGDLCGTKGVRPGNDSFDDRAYVRLRID